MKLNNKIVLITGASSGIGKACAEVFAEAGAKLILIARRKDKLENVSENIFKNYGSEIYNIVCDIRDYDELVIYIKALPGRWNNIDVLINNAGKARGMNKIQDGNTEDWNEMIDTNIKGLLYISNLIIPKMVNKRSGHIINIGSIAGREVYPNGNIYCATKAAVSSISKGMTIDLNGTGIRVTNIEPGLVETEFSIVRFYGNKESAKKIYEGYTPLTGKDIAETALFAVTRPPHVMIQNVLITPTDQATATILNKKL